MVVESQRKVCQVNWNICVISSPERFSISWASFSFFPEWKELAPNVFRYMKNFISRLLPSARRPFSSFLFVLPRHYRSHSSPASFLCSCEAFSRTLNDAASPINYNIAEKSASLESAPQSERKSQRLRGKDEPNTTLAAYTCKTLGHQENEKFLVHLGRIVKEGKRRLGRGASLLIMRWYYEEMLLRATSTNKWAEQRPATSKNVKKEFSIILCRHEFHCI